MKWLIIRHGMTEGNKRKQYIGSTDQPLTEEGKEELRKKQAAGAYREAEEVLRKGAPLFVSPMKRCISTAELLFPDIPFTVVNEFREIDFGEFEEKSWEDLQNVPAYQEWIDSNGLLSFPGGEGQEEFTERIRRGVELVRQETERRRAENDREDDRKDGPENDREDGPENDREDDSENDPEKETVVVVAHGGTIMAANVIFLQKEFYDGLSENGEMRIYRG